MPAEYTTGSARGRGPRNPADDFLTPEDLLFTAADFLPGPMLAALLQVHPSTPIIAALGSGPAERVFTCARFHQLGEPETLGEAELIPVPAVADLFTDRSLSVPSLGVVSEWCRQNRWPDPEDVRDEALRRIAEREAAEARNHAADNSGVPQRVDFMALEAVAAFGALWSTELARTVETRNRWRDPSKPPQLVVTIGEALRAGASEVDLAQIPKLTPEQWRDLQLRQGAYVDDDAARRAELRSEITASRRAQEDLANLDFVESLAAVERAAEPPALVENVVYRQCMTTVIGVPGVGKSMFAIGLAVAMAAGLPRYMGLPVTAGKVLYLVGEGATSFPRRLAAVALSLGLKGDPFLSLDGRLFLIRSHLDLSTSTAQSVLLELIRKHGIDLVVVDTFNRYRGRGTEENSATEVGRVTGGMEAISQATGCASLILHHPASASARPGEPLRSRGSSALPADADLNLQIRPPKGTRPRDKEAEVYVQKNRNGRDGFVVARYRIGEVEIPAIILPPPASGGLWSGPSLTYLDPFTSFESEEAAEEDSRKRAAAAVLSMVAQALAANSPIPVSMKGKYAEAPVATAAASTGLAATDLRRVAEELRALGVLQARPLSELPAHRKGEGQRGRGEYLRVAEVYPGSVAAGLGITPELWNLLPRSTDDPPAAPS